MELDGTEAKRERTEECMGVDAPRPSEEGCSEIFGIHRRSDDDVAEGVDDDHRGEDCRHPPAK
jgi:hypothetical protein